MAVITARIIVTPGAATAYKVVLEHDDGSAEECPVDTVRKGEEIIREHIPPIPRDQASAWQPPRK